MPLSISILFSFLIPYFWYCSVFSWCCVCSWSSVWRRTGSRCRSGVSLDIVALGVWVIPGGSNWEKVVFGEGVWELWEEGHLLRPCPAWAAVCSLAHFRGGLSQWGAPEAAPWATSGPCGCCRKGAAGGEQPAAGKVMGGGRRSFAGRERVMLSVVTSWESPCSMAWSSAVSRRVSPGRRGTERNRHA